MKYLSFLIPVLLTLALASCEKNKSDIPSGEIKAIALNPVQKSLVQSNNLFGFQLLQTIDQKEASLKNLFISPLSISICLAMTWNGADGETRTAMKNTLGISDISDEEINEYFEKIEGTLVTIDPKVTMEIANSIWYREEFYVLPEFLSINNRYYRSEVSSLNFADPASADIINSWVADKTHDKIKSIINLIEPDMVMYLINAIYFKGQWKYEFNENETHPEPFHYANGNLSDVPCMSMKASVNYLQNDVFSAIELPYGAGNFAMDILLPEANKTVHDIIENLNPEKWDEWVNAFNLSNVSVNFPRFKFAYERTMNEDLKELGMGIAFGDGGIADFTRINPDGGLQISYVKHKSFVEVNEKGTEAAAVTVVGIELTSAGPGEPNYIPFVVNKPFVFVIRETTTNTLVFIGKVMDPLME